MRVLYLDVDDEITSAASRIRSAEEIRVAAVLPYASRVATSRINFRLLARDATLNGKRLSIIAGDAATRALAASAGLPIYATVAEYEAALADEKAVNAASNGGEAVSGAAVVAAAAGAPPPTPPATRSRRGSRTKPTKQDPDEGATAAVAAVPDQLTLEPVADASPAIVAAEPAPEVAAGATQVAEGATPEATGVAREAATAAAVESVRSDSVRSQSVRSQSIRSQPIPSEPRPAGRAPAAVPAARVIADTPARPVPVDRPFGPLATRMPLLIGAGVLALALLVGAVGSYLLLPTATVVITPRQASIGPIELQVTADPSATQPDQATMVVPASQVDVPVDASQTFKVTGKRVEQTKATGSVRFRNYDDKSTNTIPRGSIVSTRTGIQFQTDRAITVARASQFLGQTIPASASVTITAVNGGPAGNVESNTIREIPSGENQRYVDVTNPNPTSGGKREVFPRVAQVDIDKATTSLRDQLTADFQAKVGDPALAGEATTVFPETGVLGEPTLTVDPKTLLGDEIASFDLGATATGTVLAVDESAVRDVAGADIATHVEPGYTLVDGSSNVEASPGVVEGGVITFPVVITARESLVLDPDAIEAEIRGKPLSEAQSLLGRYGTADVSVWPDWVGAIPTLDARVEVRSTASTPTATPAASP